MPTAVTYDLFVREIAASCSATKPEITRVMRCVDLEHAESYGAEVSLTLPAIDGVGTGDVLSFSVHHKMNALEHELMRAVNQGVDDDDDA